MERTRSRKSRGRANTRVRITTLQKYVTLSNIECRSNIPPKKVRVPVAESDEEEEDEDEEAEQSEQGEEDNMQEDEEGDTAGDISGVRQDKGKGKEVVMSSSNVRKRVRVGEDSDSDLTQLSDGQFEEQPRRGRRLRSGRKRLVL